jgi:outer membrane lipoprotein carrier protein
MCYHGWACNLLIEQVLRRRQRLRRSGRPFSALPMSTPPPLRLLVLVAALLPLPPDSGIAAQAAAGRSAQDIARALQQHYEGVRDFSADFVHTYEGGVLRQTTSERGTVVVKKPGRMRWTYTAPEEKVFVSDGQKIYSYMPADKQVIVSELPSTDEASTPILFLAGKGDLIRDFTVSHAEIPDAPPNSYALRLVPKQPQPEYEWLAIVVDRDTFRIHSLITGDQQGGTSRIAFSNFKENVGIPDRAFQFRIPRGVDVITG